MAAVQLGGKVLVLTVDPARRLANALGLEQFGNVETRVPPELFADAGVEPRGELWAAMLDTKQSWDDLVRRHAPDAADPRRHPGQPAVPEHHRQVRAEPRLHRHGAAATRSTRSGRYDLIVVDTPPTRNAIDFLEAPERMADFFSQPAAALADRARTARGW